jgi:hypothetical protein
MSMTETLADVIRDAGYIAVAEGDWVSFNVEGTTYRFETFDSDAGYARLMVGFTIPSDVGLDRLLTAANEQNRKTKGVKTVVYALPEDGHVSFSIEMFFGEAQAWEPVFERALAALRATSAEYYGSLKALEVA